MSKVKLINDRQNMLNPQRQTFAVITGDVVGFSRLSSSQRAALSGIVYITYQQTPKYFKDSVSQKIDIFRGDSWQFVLNKPKSSLRIALFFRAFSISQMALPSIDTRLAIGIGPVDFLPSEKTRTGDGEAFRQSGLGLDEMPRNIRMNIKSDSAIGALDINTIDVLVKLIDAIVKDWTPRQACVACGAILGWKQGEITSSWLEGKISQQAIAQHLNRAKWNAVSAAIKHFEDQ